MRMFMSYVYGFKLRQEADEDLEAAGRLLCLQVKHLHAATLHDLCAMRMFEPPLAVGISALPCMGCSWLPATDYQSECTPWDCVLLSQFDACNRTYASGLFKCTVLCSALSSDWRQWLVPGQSLQGDHPNR
jgi:hypothetical protein